MSEIKLTELVLSSKRLGERTDFVQAGGGNTSLKSLDGIMYIKSSGIRLSDIKSKDSFAQIDYQKLRLLFSEEKWEIKSKEEREYRAKQIVDECNLTPDRRPSIETLLHLHGEGFGIHIHAKNILQHFSGKLGYSSKEIAEKWNLVIVPYSTPGIDLVLSLIKSEADYFKSNKKTPHGYILSNHGLLVFGDNNFELLEKIEEINKAFEINTFRNTDSKYHKFANFISDTIQKFIDENPVVYHSSHEWSPKFNVDPLFPDSVVFLGVKSLMTNGFDFENELKKFFKKYSLLPKHIVYDQRQYFIAPNMAKAKEAEEVWLLQKEVIEFSIERPIPLSQEEILYLSNWEAEKYRQKV